MVWAQGQALSAARHVLPRDFPQLLLGSAAGIARLPPTSAGNRPDDLKMSIIEAILFGLVQGVTEFIPVSSTAHIVILGKILGIETPGLTFEIFLHIASLLAVIIYFHKDLWHLALGLLRSFGKDAVEDDRTSRKMVILLGIATAITGVLGIVLMKSMGDSIKSAPVVGGALLLTAVLLVIVERARKIGERGPANLGILDAIVVGLAQTAAVIPGISRSGATLIAGLSLGLNRVTAVRFSFLLAIPVLTGSALLSIKDISAGDLSGIAVTPLLTSFLTSFCASIFSIVWLIRLLKQHRLYWFSIYLVFMAVYVFKSFPGDAVF